MLTRLVPIDEPSCNRRLDFRSWKKVFQSSTSPGFVDGFETAGFCPDVLRESTAALADEEAVDKYLAIRVEAVFDAGGPLIVLLLRCVV